MSPEQRLFQAILAQAFVDATAPINRSWDAFLGYSARKSDGLVPTYYERVKVLNRLNRNISEENVKRAARKKPLPPKPLREIPKFKDWVRPRYQRWICTNCVERDQARAWLTSGGDWFMKVVTFAGFEPLYVHRAVSRMRDGGWKMIEPIESDSIDFAMAA